VNHQYVIYSLGKLLQVIGLVMFIPGGISYYEQMRFPNDPFLKAELFGFVIAIVISFIAGTLLSFLFRKDRGLVNVREGFAIVTFGWITLTFMGAIPFMVYFLSHQYTITLPILLDCFTNSIFEAMSGFTTTGATILAEVESLPKGLLLWRSLTQWIGGMGIVTLALALFPVFGVAAYQLFRGEVPGPTAEKLKPRLAQTAMILWGVYAFFTFLEVILLLAGDMSLFDAINHSFTTLATGGFSTRNYSIASYSSPYIEYIIIMFMFLAGVNFLIHYRVIFLRDFQMIKSNRELHFYSGMIIVAIVLCFLSLSIHGLRPQSELSNTYRSSPLNQTQLDNKLVVERNRIKSPVDRIRQVIFQVVSITTTSGFVTTDWDTWSDFTRLLLVILMFFGGSAGSTAGGIKMIRILILFKVAIRQIRVMLQPRLISPVKIAGRVLDEARVRDIVSFFLLFMILAALFSVIMSTMVPDLETAVSSVISAMGNIGPGIAGVGAYENYSWIPIPGKWILILCMLLGRLEIYTVLIAFSPVSWKK